MSPMAGVYRENADYFPEQFCPKNRKWKFQGTGEPGKEVVPSAAYGFVDMSITGSRIRDGCLEVRCKVLCATRVSLSLRNGLPVLGLASKRGELEEDTSTRMRCPLLKT